LESTINPFLIGTSLFLFLAFGGFAVVSIRERKPRATSLSLFLAVVGGGFFSLATKFPSPVKAMVLVAVGLSVFVFLILFFLPIGKVEVGNGVPSIRFDERDIVFARKRLTPDSPEYIAYYKMRPENLKTDDQTREKPGLLSPKAKLANPFHFASADGSFHLTGALREAVDGQVSDKKKALPTKEMTEYIKGLALYFGALDVGITELKPYHVYSHIGRGPGTWGDPIPVEHDYAIAFTVEMSYEMVSANPTAVGVMESAKQYVEASRVAVSLAAAIRNLGYPARAHIDGSYRVICPLVARDAGLGEIGRISLLMTPRRGPRVRLGVVTTNLELIPDRRISNAALIDFCNICKKCAENCPSYSIPFGDRQEVKGAFKWQLDADTCFRYWNVVGTDCGICMKVCPYAHPNTFYHNVIRWGIKRSGFFRRAALWLDDLFYGKQPAHRKPPEWTQVGG
jgi:reductive dehalogenase